MTEEKTDEGSNPAEQSENTEPSYAILLKDDVTVPVGGVEKSIAAVLNVPLAQARMQAKKCRGIFMESLTENQARKLQNVLENLDYPSLILPQKDVYTLPSKRDLRQVWPEEDALHIQVGYRDDQFIPLPWKQVDYISAGVVGTQKYWDKTRDQAAKNLPNLQDIEDEELENDLRKTLSEEGLGARAPTTEQNQKDTPDELILDDLDETEKSDTIWIIDILCNAVPMRYRLKKDEIIFTYLKEQGVTSRSSEENFLHILTDLLFQKDDLVCTPISARLHFGEPFHELIFDDMNHFNLYTRWFFTLYEQGRKEPPELIPTLDGLDEDEND